jgi:lactobin A/cerein 7B family class IIb bacteriocin
METIMSKTEDASQVRELRDDELEQVTGGLVVISIIGIVVGLLLPAVNRE